MESKFSCLTDKDMRQGPSCLAEQSPLQANFPSVECEVLTSALDSSATPQLKHKARDQFACPANQHPRSTIMKRKPTYLCAPREFLKMCLSRFIFYYRIDKHVSCSRCVICVS